MYANLADAVHFQPDHQIKPVTVFAWLKQRLEARRQKQAAQQEIKYLRTLGRSVLEDTGIEVETLGEAQPSLMSFHPCTVAINIFASSPR